MNEEMKTFEEIENTEEVVIYEDPETSNGGCFGKLLLAAVAVGTTVAVVLHKTKDKREAKKIEKLRKKGYVIYTPDEVVDEEGQASNEDAE